MRKADLLTHLVSLLQQRVEAMETAMTEVRGAFASDTKSSAGDKHEVGRAMVQQELDKLAQQRANLIALQQELAKVPLDRKYEQVAFGSLVATDQGNYFIAIGLGMVELDAEKCFVISLASPMGRVLEGGSVGDHVRFQGKDVKIEAIV